MKKLAVLLLLALPLPAQAAPADHRCLTDPARTVVKLGAGPLTGPQTVDVKGKLSVTIDATGSPITCSVKDTNKDCLTLKATAGDAAAGTETCVVGLTARAPDMASKTWQELKDCCDTAALRPLPSGDVTVAYGVLGLAHDPLQLPRPHLEHPDGRNLSYTVEHAVLLGRDDGIEDDGCANVSVTDAYIRTHYGVSTRPSKGNNYKMAKQPVISFKDTFLELVCQPDTRAGVNKCVSVANQSHAGFWKWPGGGSSCKGPGFNEPLLQFLPGRTWLKVGEIPAGGPGQLGWPKSTKLEPGADVRVFWASDRPYPGSKLPTGVKLVTGTAAAKEYDAALEQWRKDHGCAADWSSCTWQASSTTPPEPPIPPEPPKPEPGPVPPTNAELDQRLGVVERDLEDLRKAMGLWSKP